MYLRTLWIPNNLHKLAQLKTIPPKEAAIMIYNNIDWGENRVRMPDEESKDAAGD
jgi:hypothetical protein